MMDEGYSRSSTARIDAGSNFPLTSFARVRIMGPRDRAETY